MRSRRCAPWTCGRRLGCGRAWSPSGRRAVTVFYEKADDRIGYTIISGEAIDPSDEARRALREGTVLHGLSAEGP